MRVQIAEICFFYIFNYFDISASSGSYTFLLFINFI